MKTTNTTTTINSWDDVDNALRRIAEIDIEKSQIDGDTTLKINKIREEAKAISQEIDNDKKQLEKAIELFCEANKAEFASRRSRVLNFGTIGYRLVKSVSIPRTRERVEALLRSLKAYGYQSCIVYEERPDRDEIAELDDSVLVKLGLRKTVRDSFRIQPNIEKIQQDAA